MAKGKVTSALLPLAVLSVALFLGCSGRTAVFCKSTFDSDDFEDGVSTGATIAVLPFHFDKEVPESFARQAGERLTNALASRLCDVVGPAAVLSTWESSLGQPWAAPNSEDDFRRLGQVLGKRIAIHGAVTRCLYGHLIPSKFAFVVIVVDLESGRKILAIDAGARSRKGFSYSGLSKPPKDPDELLSDAVEKVADAITQALVEASEAASTEKVEKRTMTAGRECDAV